MLKRYDGFTLTELLVAAGISLIILGLVFQGIVGGSSSTRIIQGQSQVIEELRNTGNYVSDIMAQAAFIYPPGTSIVLGSTSAYTVTKPASSVPTSGQTWVVGTDPIIAALLPPLTNSTVACSPTNQNRCIRFVAFYALKRSSVVANAPANANPGEEANDANTWMLAMYTCTIHGGSSGACGGSAQSFIPDTVPNSFSGSSGQIVADYISPDLWSLTASSYFCAKDSHGDVTMNSPCLLSSSLDKNGSAARVTLTLGSSVSRQGDSISTGAMSFQMAGRNLSF